MRCLFSLLALLLLSFSLKAQNSNLVTESVIRIKVKESFIDKLENTQLRKTDNNVVLTGIESINQLNVKNSAVSFKRLFSDGGKFRARRRAHGLHLWYEVTFNSSTVGIEQILADYALDGSIQMAEPIYKKAIVGSDHANFGPIVSKSSGKGTSATFNDPRLNEQWHYSNTGQTGGTSDADIDLPEAWDVTTGSTDVIVSIHDGGIDFNHEDIANNMWMNNAELNGTANVDDDGNGYIDDIYGYNLADNTGAILPGDHGTHVAGTVAAESNNGVGVAGVAGGSGSGDGARLMSVQVFGSGVGGFAESYAYAADNGAIISQNSWGYTSPGTVEQAVLDGIDYFIANAGYDETGNPIGPMQGGIVIFAAGNSDSSADYYPGYYDPVLAVASTNHNDQKAWYSNYGTWVDISAPGGETSVITEGVLSTLPNNSYGFFQGTSMACPHVSGVAALIVSAYGGTGFTPAQLRGRLTETTDFIDDLNPGFEGELGAGRMNAFASLLTDDGIAPDAITNLSTTEVKFDRVTLNWTAPADADNVSASSYEIRYSTSTITAGNFDAATLIAAPGAQSAGTAESFEVNNLSANTNYYFAIKSYDFFSNGSVISNVASVTTEQVPEITVTPPSLTSNLFSGDSEVQSITIENTGLGTLDYSLPVFAVVSATSKQQNVANSEKLVKGEKDTRVGNPILNGAGDDGESFGYQWIDSNEAGGPTFNWEDISSTGTQLSLSDDSYQSVSLPFDFPFYEALKSTVYVSSNGFLSFSSSGANSLSNSTLPNPNTPNDVIALLWNDLNPSSGGAVYYLSEIDKFIVQYNNVPLYGAGGSYTFQCILYPNGDITIQYLSLSSSLSSYTSGIENNDGSIGLEIAYNTVHAEDNLAIRITKQPPLISDVNPTSGSLAPGEQISLDVTISASGLNDGTYEDEVIIESNDPNNVSVNVPLTLNVTGAPSIVVEGPISFEDTFIGGTDSLEMIITNNGSDILNITSITIDEVVFSLDTSPFSLNPSEEHTLVIYFEPVAVNDYTGTITVNSNDTSDPVVTIDVTGSGIEPPVISITPTNLTENLFTGETSTQTFTIENIGNNDLVISNSINITAMPSSSSEALNTPPKSDYLQSYSTPSSYSKEPISTVPYDMVALMSDSSVIFSDDMEVTGAWNHYAVVGTTDSWNHSTARSNSGSSSWHVAQHPSAGSDALESPSINLVGAQEPFMSFVSWYEFDDCGDNNFEADGVIVEISTDNGNSWVKITPLEGYPYVLDDQCNNPIALEEAYSHSNEAFTLSTFDLTAFVGEEVKIRFYAGWDCGNCSTANEGFYLDDFVVYDAKNWIAIDEVQAVIAPGSSQQFMVNFDATGLFGGVYEADIVVDSNDPLSPSDTVLATLNVTGAPDIALEKMSVAFDSVFIGDVAIDSVEIVNIGTDILTLSQTNSNSDYQVSLSASSLNPGESIYLLIEFTPSVIGILDDVIALSSNDPDESLVNISLSGVGVEPPVIGVSPTSISSDLFTGETTTRTITISNAGTSDLIFSLDVFTTNQNANISDVVYYDENLRMEHKPFDGNTNVFDRVSLMNKSQASTIFDDDFENGQNGWTIEAYGIDSLWHLTTTNYNSAISSWYCAVEGQNNYNTGNTISTAVVTPAINLTNYASDSLFLEFYETYDTEPGWDYCHVEVTTDEGNSWNAVRTAPSGSSGGWIQTSLDLSQYLGQIIKIRFYFDTGDGVANDYPGWYFDDVKLKDNSTWFSVNAEDFVVPSGQSTDIEVLLNATGLTGGTYESAVEINSNDPVTPVVTVPVTLNVTGAANIVVDKDTIDFEEVFVGEEVLDSILISNNGTEILSITSIVTSHQDITLDQTQMDVEIGSAQYLTISYIPQTVEQLDAIITITSNDPSNDVLDISLIGYPLEPPVILVDRESVREYLVPGDSSTVDFGIHNTGNSDLTFSYSVTFENENTSTNSVSSRDVGFYADLSRYKVTSPLNLGDTISSDDSFIPNTTGMTVVNGMLYAVAYGADSLIQYDLNSMTKVGGFPIHDEPYGIAYDGQYLWIGDYVGNVYGYDMSGNLEGSFSCPFTQYPALGHDGTEFIANPIFTNSPSIYKLDVQGSVLNSYAFDSYVYNYVYVPQHDSFWAIDQRDLGRLYELKLTVDSVVGNQMLELDASSFGYSIAHDDEDLLISDWYGNITSLDDGFLEYSWLEVNFEQNVITVDDSSIGTIKFNASDLEPGDYYATITIMSNDPQTPIKDISIHLNVCDNDGNNTPPSLITVIEDDLSFIEDGKYFLDLSSYFSDAEDDLTYKATSSDVTIASAKVTEDILTVEPYGIGSINVTVSAYDGHCGEVSETFTLNFDNYCGGYTNTNPILLTGFVDENINLDESITYDLTDYIIDEDGHNISYLVEQTNELAEITLNGDILTIIPTSLGSSTISITAEDERCGILTTSFNLNVENITSLDTKAIADVSVFPQPVDDYLTIDNLKTGDNVLVLWDAQGKLVREINTQENNVKINTVQLKAGIYLLQINNNNDLTTKRILVTH